MDGECHILPRNLVACSRTVLILKIHSQTEDSLERTQPAGDTIAAALLEIASSDRIHSRACQ
jgi:hypothetical protein